MQHIADFLDISVSGELLPGIADAVMFANAKQKAEQLLSDASPIWKGGAKTFINKGTNGRWCTVLTNEVLVLYEAAVARELTPDCAIWLGNGRLPFLQKQALVAVKKS